MDNQMEQTISSLRSRHISGFYAEDHEEANQKVLALIPQDAVVGLGDSTALRQLGTIQALKERGIKCLNPFEPRRVNAQLDADERWRLRVAATLSDVYLTGTNAITQDGRLVNVDGTGNRVAGMFWGHPLSIIVVGRNKIVKDLEEAFYRTRKIIAPAHHQIRTNELGGRKRKLPCVSTGECNDCRGEDRGCNVFSIIEGKPRRTNLNVILVNQDIGLGWDPSWPQERIAKIIAEYKKFAWEGTELPGWSRKGETS